MTNYRSLASASALLLCLLLGFTACDNDSYETGDTDLSYLHADFVMAHTAAAKQVVDAVNDDGESISLDKPLDCEWATEANSSYRALLYYTYNKVEDEKPHAVSIVSVPVLTPKPLAEGEQEGTDPVGWESAWLSKNGQFLNLSILLKNGTADGLDTKQVVGVVKNQSEQNADGTTTHHLAFYHLQNGVPEYYTSRLYVSIPTDDYRSGDTVVLTVNTYSGIVERTFVVSR